MADNFNYTLTLNDQGTYVLRSTVQSFNLQQVTDKDIVSFYQNFSNASAFDSGLLPLDGTGLLALRYAGNHMQITVQHKPGTYYVNWGAHEGDARAKTYLVAQPYRIIIGDFVDGQLLGARMFYSPFPITHPDMNLYHVNLPNINCKGYRGNGVGWICLYLKEDWSNIPFNEKVSRFIERCSGVETYNDANMSETDGPRFYQEEYEHNSDFAYLWNPAQWEKKSEEGFEWTLNPDLWIPVKVSSIDSQGQHSEDGINLTLSGALLGNYKAYYTDDQIPKFYNVVARPDLNLNHDHVAKFVKKSFSAASVNYTYDPLNNPLKSTVDAREDKASQQIQMLFSDDEDEDTFVCVSCDEAYSDEPTFNAVGDPVCEGCLSEYYVYLQTPGEYYHIDDSVVHYNLKTCENYHFEYDTVKSCSACGSDHAAFGSNATLPVYSFYLTKNDEQVLVEYCSDCMYDYAEEHSLEIVKCSCGNESYILDYIKYTATSIYIKSFLNPVATFSESGGEPEIKYEPKTVISCASCFDQSLMFHITCPCGMLVESNKMQKCSITPVQHDGKDFQVTSACQQCITNIALGPQNIMIGDFKPLNFNMLNTAIETGIILNSTAVLPSSDTILAYKQEPDDSPF